MCSRLPGSPVDGLQVKRLELNRDLQAPTVLSGPRPRVIFVLSGLELTRTAPPHDTANPCLARFGRVLAPPSTPSMHSRRPPPRPAVCASARARHARKTRQRACCWRAEWHVSTVGPQRRCVRGSLLAAHHQPDTLPSVGLVMRLQAHCCTSPASPTGPNEGHETLSMREHTTSRLRRAVAPDQRREAPDVVEHQGAPNWDHHKLKSRKAHCCWNQDAEAEEAAAARSRRLHMRGVPGKGALGV